MTNQQYKSTRADGTSSHSTTNSSSGSNSSHHSQDSAVQNNNNNNNAMVTFCQYVPLRLTVEERTLLQVLESTLYVSEYTDHVDVSMRRQLKVKRILDSILEATHIGTGLAVAGGVLLEFNQNKMEQNENHTKTDNHISDGATTPDTTHASTKTKRKNLTTKKKKKKAEALNGTAIAPTDTSTTTTNNNINNNNNMNKNTNLASRDPVDNAHLFQTMFEVGRRNKVLNPSSMRDSYGKMMYLLQDAQSPTVAKSLGFSLHKDLCLVGSFLHERNATALLYDVRLKDAVRVISDRDSNGIKIPRDQINAMVQHQQTLRSTLAMEYATTPSKPSETTTTTKTTESELSPATTTTSTTTTTTTTTANTCTQDDIHRVLESIRDAMAYVDANVKPVQTMLDYLEEYFDPHHPEGEFSLQLTGGSRGGYSSSSRPTYGFSAFHSSSSSNYSGPTLSHSHSTQYTFCWQSLRLWCKIQRHMHQLWVCADTDLLSTSTAYHLHNTGQGLHRVQSCPKVASVMRSLLNSTQQEAGAPWVGLSVIHLGDRDVPNALIFIDKYTQIPRFLHPICTFMNVLLEEEYNHNNDDENDDENENHTNKQKNASRSVLNQYIVRNFQSHERLMKLVLADYFKHGFDGSGDDGGSCIDGRLTSSWNWTSLLAKKPYYHAMLLLSGFQGFDGDFK